MQYLSKTPSQRTMITSNRKKKQKYIPVSPHPHDIINPKNHAERENKNKFTGQIKTAKRSKQSIKPEKIKQSREPLTDHKMRCRLHFY